MSCGLAALLVDWMGVGCVAEPLWWGAARLRRRPIALCSCSLRRSAKATGQMCSFFLEVPLFFRQQTF